MKTPTIIASGAAAPAPAPLATGSAGAPVLVGSSGLVAALVAASIAVLSASAVEVTTTYIQLKQLATIIISVL